jgi:serine/threonine protein kinase
MYCATCSLHFSGSKDDRRCPYCGGEGDPSGSTPQPAPAVRREGDLERTVTEFAAGAWTPGSVIAGKYEVVTRLGSGGFGSVYKVRHLFRKKYYALKTPHPEYARDELFRRRFEREIEAMERFVHPDAVMIRDSGVTAEGSPYYTMDFIEGESLKALLRRHGKLPCARAIEILTCVLQVIDSAHAHGVIHRDLKPDNILLTTANGREAVKVLDFGVAKLLDIVGETNTITRGDRVGTPKYMSPEQITGEPIDPRSDLFSLGIVFYEMVTGRHPFGAIRDPVRITAAILNHDPMPPRDVCPEIPRGVSEQILLLLEKKPKRRPLSAAAVLRAFEGLAAGPRQGAEAGALRLSEMIARAPARPLVLVQAASPGERRCFVFFEERVSIGRSNDAARGIHNHLILRCLPCRSQDLDPENWQRNLTISHRVGWIYPRGSTLVIEPAPDAKQGIGIGGVKSLRTARLQSDRFHLSIGDRALEIDGHRFLAPPGEPEFDLSFLAAGRPDASVPAGSGYSNPACRIECARLLRASNWPLHEYYLVYKVLRLGNNLDAGLRLSDPHLEGTPAAIVHEAGEAFLLVLGEGVLVLLPGAAAGAASPAGSGVEVPPRTLVPLVPGIEIALGSDRFRVEAAAESHFKSTREGPEQ